MPKCLSTLLLPVAWTTATASLYRSAFVGQKAEIQQRHTNSSRRSTLAARTPTSGLSDQSTRLQLDQLQQDLCKLANWSDKWLLTYYASILRNVKSCTLDIHILPSTTWRTRGQWSVTATSDNNQRERSRNIHNRRPETEQTVCCPSFSEGHVSPGKWE